MSRFYFLYFIINLLEPKLYIGQTVNPKRRWGDHKWLAKNKQEQFIHRAMNKYGSENFVFEVIATCKTQEDADETEAQLILQYDSRNKENGYNISLGGDPAWNRGLPKEQQPMFGKKQSKEFCELMSKIHKGKIAPHSKEWSENVSASLMGHSVSLETRNKISLIHKGVPKSKEHKNKLFLAHIGKSLSEETKNKISIANRGKKISEEHKNILRDFHTGRKMSDESKKKVSDANTGRFSGEKNVNAKLTWDIVEKIREEYSLGNVLQKELAIKYGVDKTTISKLVLNKIWNIL